MKNDTSGPYANQNQNLGNRGNFFRVQGQNDQRFNYVQENPKENSPRILDQNNQEIQLNFYQEAPQNDPPYNQQLQNSYSLSQQANKFSENSPNQPSPDQRQNQETFIPDQINNDNVSKDLRPQRSFLTKKHTIVFRCEGEEVPASDKIRFIRIILGMVLLQLIINAIVCAIAYSQPKFQQFQLKYWYLSVIAAAGLILIETTAYYKPRIANQTPQMFITFSIFTIFLSYDVSYVCSYIFYLFGQDGSQFVLICTAMCLGYTIGLTLYTLKIRNNYKFKVALVCMLVSALFTFALFTIFFRNFIIETFYCLLLCSIFGFFVNWDIECVFTNRNHQYGNGDYIVAVLFMYLDVFIMIFDVSLHLMCQN